MPLRESFQLLIIYSILGNKTIDWFVNRTGKYNNDLKVRKLGYKWWLKKRKKKETSFLYTPAQKFNLFKLNWWIFDQRKNRKNENGNNEYFSKK